MAVEAIVASTIDGDTIHVYVARMVHQVHCICRRAHDSVWSRSNSSPWQQRKRARAKVAPQPHPRRREQDYTVELKSRRHIKAVDTPRLHVAEMFHQKLCADRRLCSIRRRLQPMQRGNAGADVPFAAGVRLRRAGRRLNRAAKRTRSIRAFVNRVRERYGLEPRVLKRIPLTSQRPLFLGEKKRKWWHKRWEQEIERGV